MKIGLNYGLNCKDCYIIYIAQCTICNKLPDILKEDTYFGQTITPFHIRMNGHRGKFNLENFDKSALSFHCKEIHEDKFSLKHFKLGIVSKCKPTDLDREEARMINKFRTNIWGLNRYNVIR